ncbi:uncharacterized protein LOC120291738 [Eucalyptus grandis]|uniref:uncharacterized protein LOC120291738 n=1 Tax=Eucalyptus grandis TaxID=71139 RepID=UPI00192E8A07|nr:uncharacterized protein LOC120291738 [Eucalyptus grandis]
MYGVPQIENPSIILIGNQEPENRTGGSGSVSGSKGPVPVSGSFFLGTGTGTGTGTGYLRQGRKEPDTAGHAPKPVHLSLRTLPPPLSLSLTALRFPRSGRRRRRRHLPRPGCPPTGASTWLSPTRGLGPWLGRHSSVGIPDRPSSHGGGNGTTQNKQKRSRARREGGEGRGGRWCPTWYGGDAGTAVSLFPLISALKFRSLSPTSRSHRHARSARSRPPPAAAASAEPPLARPAATQPQLSLEGIVAGGSAAAGVAVEAALCPIDTIKTRLQAILNPCVPNKSNCFPVLRLPCCTNLECKLIVGRLLQQTMLFSSYCCNSSDWK